MSRSIQSMVSKTIEVNDDDLLVSSVITNKSFRCPKKRHNLRKHKPPPRTVLSWLVHSGVVYLNEVIQFRSTRNDAIIKEGIVKNNYLLCLCCGKELSITEFKRHAGFILNGPCMNLFKENGKPLISSHLEAWSAEYQARKAPLINGRVFHVDENDDYCGLCGGGGELVCCDNCPSAFHQACMIEQVLPPGSWFCLHCCCQICGVLVNDKDGGLRCFLCKHKYHYGCMQRQIMDGGSSSDRWFCTQNCHEVYSGLQSWIGLMNHLFNGISWTLLKCIDGNQKAHSSKHFVALKAECNSKLAVAIKIMEECFWPMEDEDTKISTIPQAIYNWGSQLPRLNYKDFYTVILEKDDVIMSVACIRIHGAELAELPFIATCQEHRGKGNFKLLVKSIEKMLQSLNVKKLLVASHSTLVNTWMNSFNFQHLKEDEKQNLRKINLMVLPDSTEVLVARAVIGHFSEPFYFSCPKTLSNA